MDVASIRNALKAIGLCLLAVILPGCGEQPARYPVAGKVLIDGEPLSTGSIRFVPESGRPVSSEILSDGAFALAESSLSSDPTQTGVAPGKYRVAVSASRVVDEDAGEVEWLAPSKYADFRTSEIAVEIDGPQNELVVDLTWDGNESPQAVESKDESTDTSNDDSTEQEASSEK